MKAKDRDQVRRELRERVSRRVAGRGVPTRAVEDAVDRVLSALAAGESPERARPAGASSSVVVVLSSTTPDLASRVRSLLQGQAAQTMASATAGRHTVVTARVSQAGRELLERAAGTIPASFSILSAEGGLTA